MKQEDMIYDLPNDKENGTVPIEELYYEKIIENTRLKSKIERLENRVKQLTGNDESGNCCHCLYKNQQNAAQKQTINELKEEVELACKTMEDYRLFGVNFKDRFYEVSKLYREVCKANNILPESNS